MCVRASNGCRSMRTYGNVHAQMKDTTAYVHSCFAIVVGPHRSSAQYGRASVSYRQYSSESAISLRKARTLSTCRHIMYDCELYIFVRARVSAGRLRMQRLHALSTYCSYHSCFSYHFSFSHSTCSSVGTRPSTAMPPEFIVECCFRSFGELNSCELGVFRF